MRFLVADDHSIVRMDLKLTLKDDFADVTIKETENGNEIVK
jgi:DNA-binding NarL/FixJ family response regulator